MSDEPRPSQRLTKELRLEQGRSRRRAFPRSEHARWTPDANRPSVVELLKTSNEDRLTSLVPKLIAFDELQIWDQRTKVERTLATIQSATARTSLRCIPIHESDLRTLNAPIET